MNRKRLFRRLGVTTVLLALLVLATAAPAMPAAPLDANLSLSTASSWAGHPACGAPVTVQLGAGVSNVGGYETKLSFDDTYLGYTTGSITQADWLASTGRSTSGDESTPLLEAIDTGSVKFGDYSWGSNDGPNGPGALATVKLDTVVCGTSNASLSESQVVDIMGNPYTQGTQGNADVTVFSRYDTNGDGGFFINSGDVLAVVDNLGPRVQGCEPGYQYDANGDGGFFINSGDVLAVVDNLGPSGCQ